MKVSNILIKFVGLYLKLNFFFLLLETQITSPDNTMWPDIEDVCNLAFDPYPRDPKFALASPVYSEKLPKCFKGLLPGCTFKMCILLYIL